jgi:hypothetical protein
MATTTKKAKKDTHPCAGLKQDVPGKIKVRVGRKTIQIDRQDSETVKAPVMVACGVGVDSVAMLVLMHKQGRRPDAILFADVGSEKPETYAYLEQVLQPWLAKVGFPPVVVVRKTSKKYNTIYENCIANETLPSLAYGFKGCSMKWKIVPQDQWARQWEPAYTAWAHGKKVIKLIGYDASPADSKRYAGGGDTQCYEYQYPLREAGLTREESKALIRSEGLPIPTKSACFFCPAMKTSEIDWLREHHPELVEMALAMEENYQNGHNFRGHETTQEPVMDKKTGEQAVYKRGPKKDQPKFKLHVPVRGLFGQNGKTWKEYLEEADPQVAAQMESSVSCDYREGEEEFAKGYPV